YKELCKVEIPPTATAAQKEKLAEEQLRRDSNYFCLIAKGREDEGDLVSAFEHYLAFGNLAGNRELLDIPNEQGAKARPDVFARGRIENMIRNASADQRKPLEEKIAGQWKEVRGSNDPEKLRTFVQMFGSTFKAGREARLTLAERLIEAGGEDDLRDAQLHLL